MSGFLGIIEQLPALRFPNLNICLKKCVSYIVTSSWTQSNYHQHIALRAIKRNRYERICRLLDQRENSKYHENMGREDHSMNHQFNGYLDRPSPKEF